MRESVQMGVAYRNSYLNIIAAGAGDGSEGLFFEQGAQRVIGNDLGAPSLHEVSETDWLQQEEEFIEYRAPDPDYWQAKAEHSPIHQCD